MTNSPERQWFTDLKADAKVMSSERFAYKHGKYNLNVWDKVNYDSLPHDVEKEATSILFQTKEFLDSIETLDLSEDRVTGWIEYTKTRIDDLLTKINNRDKIFDINKNKKQNSVEA